MIKVEVKNKRKFATLLNFSPRHEEAGGSGGNYNITIHVRIW
jgi:hypothetical protein